MRAAVRVPNPAPHLLNDSSAVREPARRHVGQGPTLAASHVGDLSGRDTLGLEGLRCHPGLEIEFDAE